MPPRDEDSQGPPNDAPQDADPAIDWSDPSHHDMPTAAEPAAAAPVEPAYTGVFAGLSGGTRLKGYTILRQLGEGGMGAVYLAEEDKPRRTVALKVIRPDRVSEVSLKRFDYEAQLLGSLRHPGIAAVYSVGSFDLGGVTVPYLAMEYIAGARSLTDYARSKKLNTRDRLELFLKVCDAVQHGHQQGVIHRDLKPANILVDEHGEPRIIDFGVARSAGHDRVLQTLQTEAGQIIGTLQYMAPEQCSGQVAADIRADVYALGGVAFELLSGQLPYDLRRMNLHEATRVICDLPARALSAADASLAGDLTVIVAKALEKDRVHRYQSVSEFAGDIRRFLADLPILAKPAGPATLLRKWVSRNRQLAGALAAAAALLLVTSTVLIARIVAAERRASENLILAERNLAASRESVDLVREMLNFRGPDGESRVREGMIDIEVLLDDAAASITHSPPEVPTTEADFRELLGVGYISLRAVGKAKAQLERVLEVRRAELESPSAELASALHELARVHYFAGEFDRALPLYTESLAMRRALRPGDHADTAYSLTHLAATNQQLGNLDQAERLFADALSMRRRLHGSEHVDIAASLNNLGNLLLARDRPDEAERLLSESLSMTRRLTEPNSLEVSNASNNLARVVLALGRHDEAAALYRDAVGIRETRLKRGDGRIWSSRLGLARAMLAGLGAPPDDADDFMAGGPAARVAGLDTLGARLTAAELWDDAAIVYDWSIELTRASLAGDRQGLAARLAHRAHCGVRSGNLDDSEAMLVEGRALEPRGPAREAHNHAVGLLAAAFRDSGRDDAAARSEALAVR